MTQPQGPYTTKPTPRVDALEELSRVFSPEQLKILAQRCIAMSAQGYGDVTIRFNDGHPRFLVWSESEELPKP